MTPSPCTSADNSFTFTSRSSSHAPLSTLPSSATMVSAARQPRDGQAQLIWVPPGPGEEEMRPVMTPGPGQARPGQHAAHRALPGLGDEAAGQAENVRNDRAVNSGRNQSAASSATPEPVAWHPGASAGTRRIGGFRSTADASLFAPLTDASPNHAACHLHPGPLTPGPEPDREMRDMATQARRR